MFKSAKPKQQLPKQVCRGLLQFFVPTPNVSGGEVFHAV
jgi:hypothetical protein